MYIPNNGDKVVDGIFSWEDADLILWQHERTLQDIIRLGKEGQIHFAKQTGSSRETRRNVFNEYSEGWTVIIERTERFCLPVTRLRRGLQAEFGCDFAVNAFLTPKTAPGLSPHCDRTDVFILQISGCKSWKLYGKMDAASGRVPGAVEPSQEIELKPGDLLYLPQGFIHQGSTAQQASISLSIIPLNTFRWVDLLKVVLSHAAESDSELNKTVLLEQRLKFDQNRLKELLSNLSTQLDDDYDLQKLATQSKEQIISNLQSPPTSEFEKYEAPSEFTSDSILRRTPHVPCVIESNGDPDKNLKLCFPSGYVDLPRQFEKDLRFIADSSDEFRLTDLPGAIGETAKMALIKRLLREGLLSKAS